jgi:phosphoadenosine phosphosulfate reductase
MINLTPAKTVPEARELAELNAQFKERSPEDLLAWADHQWGQQLVLTCSFGGAAGMILIDMVTKVAPHASIVYVDTGLLFPETYTLINEVQKRYGITLRAAKSPVSLEEQAEQEGAALWERAPDRCCNIRKVKPLAATLVGYDAWIAGIRRDSGGSRAQANLVEWNTKYNLYKLNPLATWNERDVWQYIHQNNVPYNQLLDQGYRSIGCTVCTTLPTSDDPRSGRWAGFTKAECGIHI